MVKTAREGDMHAVKPASVRDCIQGDLQDQADFDLACIPGRAHDCRISYHQASYARLAPVLHHLQAAQQLDEEVLRQEAVQDTGAGVDDLMAQLNALNSS